ncbi:MAG: dTMP kinase [Planctomycetes bacterium]|nr:dTMP kinase [Planctomycetota bacterium]
MIDGPDGGGKTTQTRLLVAYLRSRRVPLIKIREPGSTRIGEKIRKIILDPAFKDMSIRTEVFLYMACRAQLIEEIIKPALKKGKVVLCERFLSSSIAYQGRAGGLGEDNIKKVGRLATDRIEPDLTIILDIASAAGLKRVRHRRGGKKKRKLDRIEARKLAFHRKVRSSFLKMARLNPAKVKLVNAAGPRPQVQAQVRKIVDHVV